MTEGYRPVIGLEVHIQLRTKSKMFGRAANDPSAPGPNINIDEIDLAHPGTLPVANKEAVRLAAMMGLALNCTIDEWSKFDRKHYFYPDLPKGYQISQLDQPIAREGWLEVQISNFQFPISNPNAEAKASKREKITKRVLIQRAHLEEDAGKNMHPEGMPYSLVDFNRAGTPLLEIVTHPVIESAEEARKYLEELQRIARYVGASDADMEKGSMRCEPSISVRKPGQTNLPNYKVEVKNINSFKFVEQAIEYEIKRQIEILERGERPEQVTMGWNEQLKKTVRQRSKEEANDYRYFPDPDLPILQFTQEYLDELRASLPELPASKRTRFREEYGLPEKDIETLLNWKELTFYFENVVSELGTQIPSNSPLHQVGGQDNDSPLSQAGERGIPPLNIRRGQEGFNSYDTKLVKLVANWCLQDLSSLLNASNKRPQDALVTPENLSELIILIDQGKISTAAAKQVFKVMFENGGDPDEIIKDLGLSQVSDEAAIKDAIKQVIADNQQAVSDYKSGQDKSFGFLVGQSMKALKGRGNPQMINAVLRELLK